MKPITLAQWNRMNPHQQSWLVCHVLGERPRVFWSLIKPDGEQVGGSYDSLRYCQRLIDRAKELTPKEVKEAGWAGRHPFVDCTIKPTASFPHYAENDHSIHDLIKKLIENHATFTLVACQGQSVCYRSSFQCGSARTDFIHHSLAQSVCLTFLAAHGLIVRS